MLSEERQKDEIRRHLAKNFGTNVPAGEAEKYSVRPLPDGENWYGIFKEGHLVEGTKRMEVFPGATLDPSSLTPTDIQKMKESSSQFLAKPR